MPGRRSILKISALAGNQGIIDAINKLERAINATADYLFRDNETPSGLINGANKAFTIADAPSPAGSLRVYLNGVYQSPAGEDYTLSNVTITFVEAPPAGYVLLAFYRYK